MSITIKIGCNLNVHQEWTSYINTQLNTKNYYLCSDIQREKKLVFDEFLL